MKLRVRQFCISVLMVALVTQVSLAQSAEYFLERVAIHARLMQAKAPTVPLEQLSEKVEAPEPEMVFASALSMLISDVEGWKELFPSNQKVSYQEVRSGLENHLATLDAASESLALNAEQAAHYDLLVLELDQAAQNIDGEYLQLATRLEQPRRRRNRVFVNVGVNPGWNAWGGPWGGWGAWGAGPYFGQPFGPGFGPGLLGPGCW